MDASSLFNKLILVFTRAERILTSSWPLYLTRVKSLCSGQGSQAQKGSSKERCQMIPSYDVQPAPLKWPCFALLSFKWSSFQCTVYVNWQCISPFICNLQLRIVPCLIFSLQHVSVVNNANNFRVFTLTGNRVFSFNSSFKDSCGALFFDVQQRGTLAAVV